jgi:hypothetical protein
MEVVRMASKYGKKSQDKVETEMHKYKRGTLKSGSGKKVTSRKQAIAIGLSEARREGGKVPSKKSASSKKAASSKKSSSAKKASSSKKASSAKKASSSKKSSSKKSTSKKSSSKKK